MPVHQRIGGTIIKSVVKAEGLVRSGFCFASCTITKSWQSTVTTSNSLSLASCRFSVCFRTHTRMQWGRHGVVAHSASQSRWLWHFWIMAITSVPGWREAVACWPCCSHISSCQHSQCSRSLSICCQNGDVHLGLQTLEPDRAATGPLLSPDGFFTLMGCDSHSLGRLWSPFADSGASMPVMDMLLGAR